MSQEVGLEKVCDICWVKTNINNPSNNQHQGHNSILENTKEHCLMEIKGTVHRNQDGHFIHANIDLDIIMTEEPETGDVSKPSEIFSRIEYLCLRRRIQH